MKQECPSQLETSISDLPICMQDEVCEFQREVISDNHPQIYCYKIRFVKSYKEILREDLR